MEQLKNNHSPPGLEKKPSNSLGDSKVRTLTISEYRDAAQCLAEAFATDEVARYFIDTEDMSTHSEEHKWNLHFDILRYAVAAHCYNGIVTTIGPNYDAIALWMPPGRNMDDWFTIFRSGLWLLYFKLSREGKTRFYGEFLPLLHKTKHEILRERDNHSLYLVYVGTKPSARGKGYAQALIEHGLAMADEANIPTYLESSAKINELYYQKFDFVLEREIALERAEKPIKLGIMVREPKSAMSNGSSKLKGMTAVVKDVL